MNTSKNKRQKNTTKVESYPESPTTRYIHWLEKRSMLHQADRISDHIAGKSWQWRNAYAHPRPQDFIRAASVWFTSYPKSIISRPDESVLQTLADEGLLATFRDIGIEGIHMGPMKRAGGIVRRRYTPTVDGFFDRIELNIDPSYGTNDQYIRLSRRAKQHDIALIGDLVPAHSGKGADFRLAERAYKNYEGLYVMIEIPQEDWGLLGEVERGYDCVNLSHKTVQLLEDKGYIPGPLEVIPFYDPGVKDTNWSATDVVTGVDGTSRRWVYLHVFKDGQPSYNWLDPTFNAQRVVMADVVQSLYLWGVTGLRLDANALLGVEGRSGLDKSWVEGHPCAEGGSDMIAMMIRKLGGYSFQELNLGIEDVKRFTTWGPDLSYDFITRTPYLYAMATGDAGPIRLIMELVLEKDLDLGMFVHALQNHDELMFNITHLRTHGDEEFSVNGKVMTGQQIYESMYERAKLKVMRKQSLIQEFSNLGFCGTLAAYSAAALEVNNPNKMSALEQSAVQNLHFLAAAFNALLPGVFALSGWDMVGALLVDEESLGSWMDDRDGRWMNRGAYDLMGINPEADHSHAGLPKAIPIYGSLTDQLSKPKSFISQLQRMLRARKASRIAFSKLVAVPEVVVESIVVLLFERPEGQGWIITTFNFGQEPAHDIIRLPQMAGRTARLMFSTSGVKVKVIPISHMGGFELDLAPLQGEMFIVE